MQEAVKLNAGYNTLNTENKVTVDNLIDFLNARQQLHEKELLEAIKECDEGKSYGPYRSVKDLMDALDA